MLPSGLILIQLPLPLEDVEFSFHLEAEEVRAVRLLDDHHLRLGPMWQGVPLPVLSRALVSLSLRQPYSSSSQVNAIMIPGPNCASIEFRSGMNNHPSQRPCIMPIKVCRRAFP